MAQVMQPYDLFVTCIDKIGPLLKIWGQIDRQTSVYIEKVLLEMLPQFDQQVNPVNPANLRVGLVCCARYKDDIYYRAQVRNLNTQIPGKVEVRFIDYGNIELIDISNIRLFDQHSLRLTQIPPQASEFILAFVVHVHNNWDETSLSIVHQEIAYTELKTLIISVVDNFYKLVKVMFHETDLASYLTSKGITIPLPTEQQELYLRNVVVGQRINPIQSHVRSGELLFTYKPTLLQPNSEHMVYVSYVEDGPDLFSIQLQSMEDALEKLMNEINQLNLIPLKEPPVPGYPCMARCLEDNTVCRAVVINLVGDKCKTYYVDFGNTDNLPFTNIYQIPQTYMLPNVMSVRFKLSGLKNVNITQEMKCDFKNFVTNKLLKLKVKIEEESPLIQYCELYYNDKNVAEILYNAPQEYRAITIGKNATHNVIVSFIEGCKRFFVQLKENTESLNTLMLALASTSNNQANLAPNDIKIGAPCCAFYSTDKQWYRAKIVYTCDGSASPVVKYVDYGNEETVPANLLKRIDPHFIDVIPAQAIECCLYGYQNMSFNSEIENVFESLTLECEFTMKVIAKQSNNVLLVDLFDMSGNNVAALLIEKLAQQKEQLASLPSQEIAKKISPRRSTSQDSQDSSNADNNKSWRNNSGNVNTGEKKQWRGDERKNWRGSASGSEDKPIRYTYIYLKIGSAFH